MPEIDFLGPVGGALAVAFAMGWLANNHFITKPLRLEKDKYRDDLMKFVNEMKRTKDDV